jgi:hypothetical protein
MRMVLLSLIEADVRRPQVCLTFMGMTEVMDEQMSSSGYPQDFCKKKD